MTDRPLTDQHADRAGRYLTPPEFAKLRGIDVHRVLAWIRSGELAAINVASTLSGRPRYRIRPEDAEAFERRRLVLPMPSAAKRKRTPTETLAWLGVDL